MANDGTFRTALKGFNRQDVAEYLESAADRYNTLKKERNVLSRKNEEQAATIQSLTEAQAELQRQAEELRDEFDHAKTEMDDLETELSGARDELASVRKALEEAQSELKAARAARLGAEEELGEICARLEAVQAAPKEDSGALAALRAQLEAAQAKASEYELMKERIATLELDASRRAAEIEREAGAAAEALSQRTASEAEKIKADAAAQAGTALSQAKAEAEALMAEARRRAEALRAVSEKAAALQTAEMDAQREAFRGALTGAAEETGRSLSLLQEELGLLTGKLQSVVRSLTDTAGGLVPGDAAAEEAPCCSEAAEGGHVCREKEEAEAPAAGEDACACGPEAPAEPSGGEGPEVRCGCDD
jgi:chromosome segregation ATPase